MEMISKSLCMEDQTSLSVLPSPPVTAPVPKPCAKRGGCDSTHMEDRVEEMLNNEGDSMGVDGGRSSKGNLRTGPERRRSSGAEKLKQMLNHYLLFDYFGSRQAQQRAAGGGGGEKGGFGLFPAYSKAKRRASVH